MWHDTVWNRTDSEMGYKKRPTKKELYNLLAAQQAENIRLVEKMNAEQIKEWERYLPVAFEKVKDCLSRHFGNLVTLLKYEHCDKAGYWFTFQLVNNDVRQTYCIRHDEIL